MIQSDRKLKKISLIEADYGQPFEDILKDFAREHSYWFTMRTLGLSPDKWREYQPLFTPYKQGDREWLSERNRATARKFRGLTVAQIADRTGCSVGTIKCRISAGWSEDRLFLPPQKRGNIENFKGRRNSTVWKESIDRDYEKRKSAILNKS